MGTVLCLFRFTTHTSDFQYNTESCHLQVCSDDKAIIRKAGSAVGSRLSALGSLTTVEEVVKQRMLTKLLDIVDNTSQPSMKL